MADDKWEVEETEEAPEQEESRPLQYEILNYPADTTLQGYLELWNNDQLKIPDFQRGYVWDQVKASKLIESFLLGLPVPGVFLYKERDTSSFMVIDGQQRIRSVVDFLKGLTHEKKFRLKKVSDKWDGLSVDELSEEDQFKLQTAIMRATIIQQLNPIDNSSIYLIFERLNTGGMNLNPMEVRQCVSHGPFVAFLKKLNADGNWRRIVGKQKQDNRLRDVELILRSIALRDFGDKYEKPMKGFLNDYMEFQKKNPSNYQELESAFSNASAQIVEALGPKPFHLRGRLNFSALDAVLTTLLKHGNPNDLKQRFSKLVRDEDFSKTITTNTSDTTVVKSRLRMANTLLFG